MKKKYKVLFLISSIFILWIGSFVGYRNYVSKTLINQQLAIIGNQYDNNPDIISELVKDPDQDSIHKGKEIVESKSYQQYLNHYFHTSTTISYIWIISSIVLWFLFLWVGIRIYQYLDRQETSYQIDRIISRNYENKKNNDALDLKLDLLNYTLQTKEEQVSKVKGDMKSFIEDVAHQVKTPLTALKINVDLSKSRESQKYIHRIDYIVNQLVQIAKLEAHTQHFQFEMNSLEECIDVVLEDISFYTNRNIETDIEECIFSFDLFWLSEAVINIVKNAIEYSHEYVGIKTSLIGDRLFIEIKDDGKVISEEEASHVFDRFYSSKDSRKQNGMGIGLNIAYEVVKAHLGKIYAYSKNDYTYFMIELPILKGKEKI